MGSSSVVVSETGGLISREEYRPYGESSFGSYAKKRFRFTGKERDEESGLYYHGARYYSPWLCRWTAPDPAGMVDGVNVYAYVRGNPVRLVDPGGMEGEESQSTCIPVEGADVDLAIRARDGKGYPNAGYRGLDVPNVAADQVQRDIEQDEFRARSGEVSSREPDIVDLGNSLFEVGVGLGLGGLRSLEEAWHGTLGNPGHHETPESRVREPETPEEELGDALSIFFPIGIRGGGSRGAGGVPTNSIRSNVRREKSVESSREYARQFASSPEREQVLERVIQDDGLLNMSQTIQSQFEPGGSRSFITNEAMLTAIGTGRREIDPKKSADHFMYYIPASHRNHSGTLEVLVHEPSGQIRHVLFRRQR
ncbi:RHS repeat-associated core domain-containing protein [Lujinxingia sediminis]|uniref:RHS repeat-associated core domain-containing protein n=1 Tax=Lujinxingia sediminis TaxID=2480984 RepID=A0ABY0CRW1_9DELT|nr:RHS repeat-associated core domain-containing protein [Lujinxingia sediminis]